MIFPQRGDNPRALSVPICQTVPAQVRMYNKLLHGEPFSSHNERNVDWRLREKYGKIAALDKSR